MPLSRRNYMKAAIFEGKGKVAVKEVPDPEIKKAHEAIVRVTHSAICGSDLWFYRGLSPQGERIGHEFMGIVEAVGDEVKDIKVGDFVIAPFVISDGTCPECKAGETRFCRHGMFFRNERIRRRSKRKSEATVRGRHPR